MDQPQSDDGINFLQTKVLGGEGRDKKKVLGDWGSARFHYASSRSASGLRIGAGHRLRRAPVEHPPGSPRTSASLNGFVFRQTN